MQDTQLAHHTGFQEQLFAFDCRLGQNIPVRELWARFAAGEFRIESAQHTVGRCFVSLSRRSSVRATATAIEWDVTERILCGDQAKVIACDLSVACSTICVHWHSTLEALCAPRALSKARAFLVICACSTRGHDMVPAILHGVNERGEAVLSVGLGAGRLVEAGLSPAEQEIAAAIVLGKASSEICAERKTSMRTVANQLHAIYRKLGISGRRELIVAALVRGLAST